MKAPHFNIEPRLHVPSPFFNLGESGGEDYLNYGRLEAELLHNVSAAVFALASANGDRSLARSHVQAARRLLTKLKVYKGTDHPHSAQQPAPLQVNA